MVLKLKMFYIKLKIFDETQNLDFYLNFFHFLLKNI